MRNGELEWQNYNKNDMVGCAAKEPWKILQYKIQKTVILGLVILRH